MTKVTERRRTKVILDRTSQPLPKRLIESTYQLELIRKEHISTDQPINRRTIIMRSPLSEVSGRTRSDKEHEPRAGILGSGMLRCSTDDGTKRPNG